MSSSPPHDLVIAGAGPSGLALADAALRQGARVAIVDPDPGRPWTPTWCAFDDELPTYVPRERTWSRARVELPGRSLRIERRYAQVDGAGLQRELTTRCAGATWVHERAITREADGLSAGGQRVAGRFVVDCTGMGALEPAAASAWQTAWGLEIVTDGHPWDPAEATWMDLRGMADVPSFLYALPIDERSVFVEETSLAARPEVPLAVLEARLQARLERSGVRVLGVVREERCRIPLDRPVPSGLAFGAAGGFVHPATGYLLTRVLGSAAEVARGVLAGSGSQALRAARGGWARDLHLLGLEVLVRSDGAELADFFAAFFAATPAVRDAFLASRPTTASTAWSMARLFLGAPNGVRRQLIAPALGAHRLREVECPSP
jgi:lycopene beta-cyclase